MTKRTSKTPPLRVRPATFAKMAGYTRQGVAKAIRDGRITLDDDGLLDPRKAAGELVNNTRPRAPRAKLARDVSAEVAKARAVAQREAADKAMWKARYYRCLELMRDQADIDAAFLRECCQAVRYRISDRLFGEVMGLLADAPRVLRQRMERRGAAATLAALAPSSGSLFRVAEARIGAALMRCTSHPDDDAAIARWVAEMGTPPDDAVAAADDDAPDGSSGSGGAAYLVDFDDLDEAPEPMPI